MAKPNYRSQDEKEALINNFLKSNLSLSKWCKENKILITTFNSWMKNYKNKVIFIPLDPIPKTSVMVDEGSYKSEIFVTVKKSLSTKKYSKVG